MNKKLFFITGNQNKLKEIQAVLPFVEQLDIDLPEIQELDSKRIIEFKLYEALKNTKDPVIVEDTSVYINNLNGLPGPLAKWFLESIGDIGIYKIAEKFNSFDAEAKTLIGYSERYDKTHYFEGVVKGKIVLPKGSGWGWDNIFQPEGFNKTFGEMTLDEKNKISMRRRAVEKLKNYLSEEK